MHEEVALELAFGVAFEVVDIEDKIEEEELGTQDKHLVEEEEHHIEGHNLEEHHIEAHHHSNMMKEHNQRQVLEIVRGNTIHRKDNHRYNSKHNKRQIPKSSKPTIKQKRNHSRNTHLGNTQFDSPLLRYNRSSITKKN